jgi:MerR family transcriptional regulator, light-induced transcriptional regulator
MASIIPIVTDQGPAVSIAAVERDTGLSKDTLRMWERRYRFPAPLRDANGERLYPRSQVEKLRLIKRLMDRGHRPGRIMTCTLDELAALTAEGSPAAPSGSDLGNTLRLVQAHQIAELRQQLAQMLMKQGLQRFVMDTVAPLNRLIGDAWMRGELAVFEEHLYSEQIQGALRAALSNLQQPSKPPRVLLTSFPNEEHRLGLLMVEALLSVEGVTCIGLGNEIPLVEIVQAAFAHRADVVALSFSGAFQTHAAVAGLKELRNQMPGSVAIWVGGRGMERVRRPIPGITLMRSLEEVIEALRAWREAHPAL